MNPVWLIVGTAVSLALTAFAGWRAGTSRTAEKADRAARDAESKAALAGALAAAQEAQRLIDAQREIDAIKAAADKANTTTHTTADVDQARRDLDKLKYE